MTGFSGEEHLCLSDSEAGVFSLANAETSKTNDERSLHTAELLVRPLGKRSPVCKHYLTSAGQSHWSCAYAISTSSLLLCLSEGTFVLDSIGFVHHYTTLSVTQDILLHRTFQPLS